MVSVTQPHERGPGRGFKSRVHYACDFVVSVCVNEFTAAYYSIPVPNLLSCLVAFNALCSILPVLFCVIACCWF